MPKTCKANQCDNPVFSNLFCRNHQTSRTDDKWLKSSKGKITPKVKDSSLKPTKSKRIKPKVRKPTGELQLFLKRYSECKGLCQITNQQIPFSVDCFMHILGKGSYPSLRLNEDNFLFVNSRIHQLYDCEGKEKLLREFPEAIVIYELKDKLRANYYNV